MCFPLICYFSILLFCIDSLIRRIFNKSFQVFAGISTTLLQLFLNMFYGATLGETATTITHILHHCQVCDILTIIN